MENSLEQIKTMTTIVADTADIASIEQYKPTDATTNPSLIYQAAQQSEYQDLIKDALDYGKANADSNDEQKDLSLDKLVVNFGCEILKLVPGRVSTEIDARLSFDESASIAKAENIIALYEKEGIDRKRVLIKLASTWEGIRAAAQLEKMDIHCNLTLLFSLSQAVACGDAGVTLISPFVGRILDWYKKSEGVDSYPPEKDPGVVSVTKIYNYLKKFDYKTEVMGASFRNKEEIIELAGIDLLTISPGLLEELQKLDRKVEQKLDLSTAKTSSLKKEELNEKAFRFAFNEDAMATEKLSEGIRNFVKDTRKLESLIFS